MMKKLFVLFTAFIVTSFTTTAPTLSDKERTYAADLLASTEQGVFNSLLGLSEVQLNFKPAPDRWSIAECVKHIGVTDVTFWKMTDGVIKGAANPEKRSDIKATDEQVVQGTESREHKVKTAPMLEPQNSSFKSTPDALASFYDDRKKLIEYVKTTNDNLRDHVATLPFGTFDSYQLILLIAAHAARHTKQIEEVKADPNFPKN
jgi:hypothetical protein